MATFRYQLRLWAWGLVVAVFSAVGDAGVGFLAAPQLVMDHWRELWPVIAFAAARSVFFYLKEKPLPGGVTTS